QNDQRALNIPLGVSRTLKLEIERPGNAVHRALEGALSLKRLGSGLVARPLVIDACVLGRGSDEVSLEDHRIHQLGDAVWTHRPGRSGEDTAELPGPADRLRS